MTAPTSQAVNDCVSLLQVLEAVCQVHVPTLPPAVLRAAVLPEARAAVHRGLLQVRAQASEACTQAHSALFTDAGAALLAGSA